MSETVGYIVCDSRMQPLRQGTENVLWIHGRQVSVFGTRAMARKAIERTKAYAWREGLKWGDEYYIQRALPVLRTVKRRRR